MASSSITANSLNLLDWGSINSVGRCNMNISGSLVISTKSGVILYKDDNHSGDLTTGGNVTVNGNLDVKTVNGRPVMYTVLFGGNYEGDWVGMRRDLRNYMRNFLPSETICMGIFQLNGASATVIGVCFEGRYTYCNSTYGGLL